MSAVPWVEAVRSVPDELITVDSIDLLRFISARARLEAFVAASIQQGREQLQGFPMTNIETLHRVLSRCPDRVIPKGTHELKFIADQGLRASLRQDIGSVEMSVRDADWKAATVIAGSVIEALLLDTLRRIAPHEVSAQSKSLVESKVFSKPVPTGLDDWTMHRFIEVSKGLGLIKDETARQARLMKLFRNLIHPGAAERNQMECNRGSAYSAVAALEFVVSDLSRRE